ncbi:hypothetical protein ACQJBY_069049 [Aegilops geniculata]
MHPYIVLAEHSELERSSTLSGSHRVASPRAVCSHNDRGDADEHRLRRLRGQREEGPSQASRRALRGRGPSAGQGDGDRHGEPEEGAARGAAHREARRAVAVGVRPGLPPRLRSRSAGLLLLLPGQARRRPRTPQLQQRSARQERVHARGAVRQRQLVQLPRPWLLRLGPPRVLP